MAYSRVFLDSFSCVFVTFFCVLSENEQVQVHESSEDEAMEPKKKEKIY